MFSKEKFIKNIKKSLNFVDYMKREKLMDVNNNIIELV